jgi:hypothetical protein
VWWCWWWWWSLLSLNTPAVASLAVAAVAVAALAVASLAVASLAVASLTVASLAVAAVAVAVAVPESGRGSSHATTARRPAMPAYTSNGASRAGTRAETVLQCMMGVFFFFFFFFVVSMWAHCHHFPPRYREHRTHTTYRERNISIFFLLFFIVAKKKQPLNDLRGWDAPLFFASAISAWKSISSISGYFRAIPLGGTLFASLASGFAPPAKSVAVAVASAAVADACKGVKPLLGSTAFGSAPRESSSDTRGLLVLCSTQYVTINNSSVH